jgi:hypothetical protein
MSCVTAGSPAKEAAAVYAVAAIDILKGAFNMPKFIDITGQTFGRLTAVRRVENDVNGNVRYLFQCSCGNEVIARKGDVVASKKTTSCGCWQKERTSQAQTTHGLSKTRLYRVWNNMRNRCGNPKNLGFHDYGGRGITVCVQWLSSFDDFNKWAKATGYADNKEIDRINNDGNYEPSNCRWVSKAVNLKNTSRVIRVTAFGETKNLSEWAADPRCRVSRKALAFRIKSGAYSTPEAAITTVSSLKKSSAP